MTYERIKQNASTESRAKLMPQLSTTPMVLIVGAGPTGLTLACELARRDVSLRLIEASPRPQPGSRGKGIQPRTLEVFDDLGIVDRVIANGQMSMPIRKTACDGQVTLGGAETLGDRPHIPYPATLITPEWRIEEALRLRLAEFGGSAEFGTVLQSFQQSDERVSAVVVKHGKPETITARWLVGCDGGHSVVRKHAGITFVGETREEVRMIVADVEVDGLDRDAWHMWSHEAGMVTLCPLPSINAFQFQASIAPGQEPELSLANMQAILEQRSSRTDIRLHNPEWSSLWRANIRLADRYREGRVFLAGDAAHIHSPAGGQGMNTGIQDAHNLGGSSLRLRRVPRTGCSTATRRNGDQSQPACSRSRTRASSRRSSRRTFPHSAMQARCSSASAIAGLHWRGTTGTRQPGSAPAIVPPMLRSSRR
jgi:2-polyprenyl-6-methoxyphenol hydroxylase-like FAD-dependent oxidoreductase